MNNTATRAKSVTMSDITKFAVGVADEAVDEEVTKELVDDGVGIYVCVGRLGVVDVSTYIPLIEAASLFSCATGVGVAACEEDVIAASAPTLLDATPPKVTKAFSARQERLEELNRVSIVLESSGMEKLDCAARTRRGMASPNVTFGRSVDKVVVVHAVAEEFVHVVPVKPLMHIHAQFPDNKTGMPPFWHAVAGSSAHFCCELRTGAGFLLSTKK